MIEDKRIRFLNNLKHAGAIIDGVSYVVILATAVYFYLVGAREAGAITLFTFLIAVWNRLYKITRTRYKKETIARSVARRPLGL